MDEGTFRNTPTVHPMERRKKLMEADANTSIFNNLDEQENRELLLSVSRNRRSEGRLPLRNYNRSARRNMKGGAGRKLRGVRKAWGSFKSRVNPRNRWKPSTQQWAANLATPHTPKTRKNLINSPLTPSTLQNSRCNGKSPRWMIYRDFNNVTPASPSVSNSPYNRNCRRSERIASKLKTPVRGPPGSPRTPITRVSDAPSADSIDSPAEDTSTMSIDASAAFQEVINRMEALNEGLATFEKIGSSLTDSIKANESHNETTEEEEEDKPTKSLRRQTSSFLRRSLRLQSS